MDQLRSATTAATDRQRSRIPRRLAILSAGGDAPGMNAAIRAVVRTANGAASN
jgi:hypothetical protein